MERFSQILTDSLPLNLHVLLYAADEDTLLQYFLGRSPDVDIDPDALNHFRDLCAVFVFSTSAHYQRELTINKYMKN